MTELGVAHVSTKTYAYLGVFEFFIIFSVINNTPPPRIESPILKFDTTFSVQF